ncbi:SDR family oxidoreductase [Gordonia malaquae]|uniref:SDR family oxidoreductase n=1 Tax=Gordonia malaquae TaxID=410332 RepID=UPI0030C79E39
MTVSKLDDARAAAGSSRYPVERRTVHNNGVDIAYFVQGRGDAPTLLLMHGWPDSHHLWDGVIPHLADRFRCVAIDSRGAGGSSNPKSYKAFAASEMATDLMAVADAESPEHKVHVLAHDWGSVAAWEAVCDPRNKDRIASYTSVSAPCASHMSYAVRRKLAHPTPRNLGLALAQAASLLYMLGSMTPGVPNILLKLTMTENRWRRGLSFAEGAAVDQIHLGPTFRKDITRTLRVYRANALQAVVSPKEMYTDVPVQVIIGTRDPAVRQSSYDDEPRWNKKTWRRVLDGGHWLPFSHPRALADAAVELADHVEGGPTSRVLQRLEMGVHLRPFEHQLVVITGAGSGIGRETAREFARLGAEVIVSDINLAAAAETATMIRRAGGAAHPYRLDVSDPDAINAHRDLVVAEHGVPDVVINNAGIGAAGDFLVTSREEFSRVIDINLYGVVNMSRAFAQPMVDRKLGGHIVNLSSMAAYSPASDMNAYATSKAAVFMFSDCLRAELDGHGIGVSTICPGIVHTNIVANTRISGVSAEEEARMQQAGDKAYAMRRYGPEKVARQIVSAVRRRREVVPVTPESKAQYLFNRVAPAAVRQFAKRGGMTDMIDKIPARLIG